MKDWKEASVTINGHELSTAESMTLRVALSCFDGDSGDDEHGRFMTKAYNEAKGRILKYIHVNGSTPSGEVGK